MRTASRVTFAFLVVALFLSGCCSTRLCPGLQEPSVSGSEETLGRESGEATGISYGALIDQKGETLEEAFQRAIAEKRKRERKRTRDTVSVRVLSLSGGGAKGAYGAGFLNGLADSASPDESLDYDIVTGISTGAIQSTYAFLGPKYYGELKEIYFEEQWETYVPRKPGISLLFCGNSLRDIDAFRARLEERYLTDEVIRNVAATGEKTNRRLIVGTVNLDTGGFQTWDMVELAQRGQYDLYRDVILASSSIPVTFPPVELEREGRKSLHVDGGVRHVAFVELVVRNLARGMTMEGGSASPSVDVLLNNSLLSFPECVQNSVLDVASRAVSTLLKQSIANDIARAYVTACANELPFRMTAFGAEFPELEQDFYPGMREDMRRLYDFGVARAKTIGWEALSREINGWQDLEKLCNGRGLGREAK